jgi:2-oxoisovalerate dehydrogenase E1 component alpha subunit
MISLREPGVTLDLTGEQLLDMYHKVLLARALGQRQRMLQRMGKGPFAVSGEGQEGAQVGSAYALRWGRDWVLPYYRDIGVALTVGMTARDILLQFFARAEDPSSGGRNMPSHFSDPKLRIVSGSAPVATQVPHAVGIALASMLKGEKDVTTVYFGEGATSTGDTHEAMNFAGIHRLPVIFVCENNMYAISVHVSKQIAVENVAIRAQGYGFPGVTVDGNDVLETYRVTKEAVERARRGEGPTFIEAKTYRLVPHSSDDDDRRYRRAEELEAWQKRDPVPRFQRYLGELGALTTEANEKLNKRVAQEVDEATEYSERAALPGPEEALTRVYVE